MTKARQMLGPIELDANGEARAATNDERFWKVERYRGGYRLSVQAGFIQLHWDGSTLEKLADVITRTAPGSATLRRWCEQVGWFRGDGRRADLVIVDEAETLVADAAPQHLTCGPLRLEWDDERQAHIAAVRDFRITCGIGGANLWACQYVNPILSTDGFHPGRMRQAHLDALAAAIRASSDPEVVRFRVEYFEPKANWQKVLEATSNYASDQLAEMIRKDAGAEAVSELWDPNATIFHWSKKFSPIQRQRYLEWDGNNTSPVPLNALVAEFMVRWDYFPAEAARRARQLVANLFAPLEIIRATEAEQVALCRARKEGGK